MLHAAIAIAAAIVLIIRFKVDPVISLIIASLYLGLAAGIGFAETLTQITGGFGEIMTKVGLLIGFGVLIGALLHATGTFADIVAIIARRVGKRLPYALSLALSMIFPSIYVDVQVVLAAPMARESAPAIDRRTGLPWLAGAMGIGIFAGYVFAVPGLAAVAIAGLIEVPLGTYMLFGLPMAVLTAVIVTWLFRVVLHSPRAWNPAADVEEGEIENPAHPEHARYLERAEAMAHPGSDAAQKHSGAAALSTLDESDDDYVPAKAAGMPLTVRLLPILVPLVLIAFAAFYELAGGENALIGFLGDANLALFVGLLIAFLIARASLGADRTGDALGRGFRTSGEILLITGVGGSLGAVIGASGLDEDLTGLFSAESGAPVVVSVVLAWFIAAVLHFAIGSVSVGAIAAGGIIAPMASSIDVAPVVIGLAIASGAMFAVHVNSNFFWLFKSLLGLSTSGALKTLTMATSLGSLVSLPFVVALALVM